MKLDIGMSLGDLADPKKYLDPLNIEDCEKGELIVYLDKMIEIRRAEERIADWVVAGKVGTPCHLGIGQEAAAVGVASQLRTTDRAFGGHRSHSHYLSMGGSLHALFAEVLGRRAGASHGMGGSMHLYDGDNGFHGSVPIVAATISIAVGAALASKMDGEAGVAVCFFGDGAAEEGVLHESLNLAASQNLPVLFVCENNLFSSHLDIEIRQPGNRVARYADSHGIAAQTVDGNDVLAVQRATKHLVDQMRHSGAPGFLEPVTYRHRGHVGPNEDIDVGVHRTMTELAAWKNRDPISRLSQAMQIAGMLDEREIQDIHDLVAERIEDAAASALSSPSPEPEQLTAYVYSRENQ